MLRLKESTVRDSGTSMANIIDILVIKLAITLPKYTCNSMSRIVKGFPVSKSDLDIILDHNEKDH